MVEQQYRVNMKLRRRGDAALDSHRIEFKSEDYDTDEDLCMAVASELLTMLTEDRDYIS